MQTVVLGSFVYKLYQRGGNPSTYVGLIFMASMAPILLFGMAGGFLADRLRRGPWLMLLQAEQGLFSLVLAAVVHWSRRPNFWALFACVAAIGIGNALNGPAWNSVIPSVVGRDDLPGALSLNATMINGSRVIGPAIAGIVYPIVGASWIFIANAITYAFVIAAVASVDVPDLPPPVGTRSERFLGGINYARQHALVRHCLALIAILSLVSLPFVSLFPSIAERSLHLATKSATYGWLYATFGCGAMLGSLAMGTLLTHADKRVITRWGLAGLGTMIFTFGWVTAVPLAFPVVFVLGLFYFGSTTALMTVLQSALADNVRGRIMALWMMGFGGTIAISAPLFGVLFDHLGGRVVLTIGGLGAVLLAVWSTITVLPHPIK